jgi:predicted nucleic acid-binding protein
VIVIDASSLAKYILREEKWEEVERHLAAETCSLTLALAEVSNAIWKHCIIYSAVSVEEAEIMFKALNETVEVITYEPLENYISRAQKIAIEESITLYDALYMAQAEKYGRILTSDGKQKNSAEKRGIKVEFID